MHLAFSLPATGRSTVSTTGLTPLNLAALVDRNPMNVASVAWPAGTMALTTSVSFDVLGPANWHIVGAILNTSLLVGTKVVFTPLDADLNEVNIGGNTQTGRIVRFADRTKGYKFLGAPYATEDGGPPIAFRVRVYNDVNGSVGYAASSRFTLGQLLGGPQVQITHQKGRKYGPTGAVPPARNLGGAMTQFSRYVAAKHTLQPVWENEAQTRGNGLDNGMDMEQLMYLLQADPWCLVIPDDQSDHLVQRSGFYGVVTNAPAITSISGPSWQPDAFEFDEIPNGVPDAAVATA